MADRAGLLPASLINISPCLARLIGLNEAAVVQRLHWALQESSDHIKADGSRWARLTDARWESLLLGAVPWEDLQPIVCGLEARGVIIGSDECEGRESGPCRWYTLNYDELEKIAQRLPP